MPIDAVTSTADHFIPGIGVDPSSSGATARIGLTYYYYPQANCTDTTCQLDAGLRLLGRRRQPPGPRRPSWPAR